jgi:hypothetical protein
MRKRLNACCKGLLEVHFYDSSNYHDSTLASSVLFNWKVDFLHRTVRDFLILPGMQTMLGEWAGDDFNADQVICEAILCQIKSAPQEEEYFTKDGPIWKFAETMEYHAELLKDDPDFEQNGVLLLLELEQTIRKQKEAVGITMEDFPGCPSLKWTENPPSQSFLGTLSRLRTMLSIR